MICKFSKITHIGAFRGKHLCCITDIRCDGDEKDRTNCPYWSGGKQ